MHAHCSTLLDIERLKRYALSADRVSSYFPLSLSLCPSVRLSLSLSFSFFSHIDARSLTRYYLRSLSSFNYENNAFRFPLEARSTRRKLKNKRKEKKKGKRGIILYCASTWRKRIRVAWSTSCVHPCRPVFIDQASCTTRSVSSRFDYHGPRN